MSWPSQIASHTVLSFGSDSRVWSTYASCAVWPILIVPLSGFSLPVIMRNSVDLPAPFGPMMPTMAPGGILNDRLSISRRSPKPLVTSSNSITSLPRRSATGMKISWVSLRFWYSYDASSSKRARRALLLAWRPFGFLRTHSSSCFIALMRACSCFDSVSSRCSFCSSHDE